MACIAPPCSRLRLCGRGFNGTEGDVELESSKLASSKSMKAENVKVGEAVMGIDDKDCS